MVIISLKMPKMTSYFDHNTISRIETFPAILVKIRHDDVILRHVTLFSIILPKKAWKSADISKNTNNEEVNLNILIAAV